MHAVQKTINNLLQIHPFGFGIFAIFVSFTFFAVALVITNSQTFGPNDSHIVNLYVDGEERIIPSRALTVEELVSNVGISLNENDLVEPNIKTEITDDNFNINVYKARPVTIVDGNTKQHIMTPYRDSRAIANNAGYKTYPEDKVIFEDSTNFVIDQTLGQKLIISRATPVLVSLYGTPAVTYRTHAKNVADFFVEQGISLETNANIIPLAASAIKPNMLIFVTKPGTAVALVEEKVAFGVESTPDPTKVRGTVTITKPGVIGKKQIVYELTLRGGKEISRKKIQEVITEQPQTQLQTLGTKFSSGLSKTKAAGTFVDSKGVAHRETYYDLPMYSVMNSCGAGGLYTVRNDGAKVDKDGFVIIAANLRNYPRCSVVETSIGPGKVYDTGGFALVHPYAFDLATDWSNNDGR